MMGQFSDQFRMDLGPYGQQLNQAVQRVLEQPGKNTETMRRLIGQLPRIRPSRIALDRDRVLIGRPSDLSPDQQARLHEVLMGLKPWRKGPFELFGIQVESEWNSALKWNRVAPHIAPLGGRRVLDVGCSNGYYLLRMTAQNPRLLLGIEPYAPYYYQYSALQHFLSLPSLHCLPLRLEDLTGIDHWFDTLFCMGILYHRRSPLETLIRLREMLTRNGQLIVETLIIEDDQDMALFPRERYARMRNVYFIPTLNCLRNWMLRCGFNNIRCVDIAATTLEEQRKTPWIDSDSLDAFLDPYNDRMTIEGYPAPVRAVIIAEAA